MTDITVLKHLTAVRLEVTIWSARRKLTAADLCAPNLPPETVASHDATSAAPGTAPPDQLATSFSALELSAF